MNRLFILTCIFCASLSNAKAQTLKLDYFTKVPTAFKDCGALYTYDTTSLKKKKYIVVVDFQNKGAITVAGKQVALLLSDSKLVGKSTNVSTFKGSGYTVILSVKTTKHTDKIDLEEGTLEVSKGKDKLTIKIHGQSSCDESKQEGNM